MAQLKQKQINNLGTVASEDVDSYGSGPLLRNDGDGSGLSGVGGGPSAP